MAGLRRELRRLADPQRAIFVQGYFKTGPGQYGEGDRFLGVTVPQLRRSARGYRGALIPAATTLLRSPWHEERLLAVMLLVRAFAKATPEEQRVIYRHYLANTRFINNWDLVDASAPYIVGPYLKGRSKAPLDKLARSPLIWDRRIAIVATSHFIRAGEFGTTMRLARTLASDSHDLIHKAVGWMLREVAKRDRPLVERFLARHRSRLPRTALRYAIERFPPRLRRRFLAAEGVSERD